MEAQNAGTMFDKPILDLNGNPIDKERTAGQILAEILVRGYSSDEEEILQMQEWAETLNSGKELKIKASEKARLREIIVRSEVTVLVKAALLKML